MAADAPSSLHQSSPHRGWAGLGDARSLLALRARSLARGQPQVTLNCVSAREPTDVVESGNEAHAGNGTDSWNRHQPLTDGLLLSKLCQFLVGRTNLLVDRFDRLERPLHVVR